jgi:hypothetical protein
VNDDRQKIARVLRSTPIESACILQDTRRPDIDSGRITNSKDPDGNDLAGF